MVIRKAPKNPDSLSQFRHRKAWVESHDIPSYRVDRSLDSVTSGFTIANLDLALQSKLVRQANVAQPSKDIAPLSGSSGFMTA